MSAPSSSRTLLCTRRATCSTTSSATITPLSSALLRKMAMRVSRSGEEMSAIKPHSKRERRRSSRSEISFGVRSEVITICLPAECSALKVWKNSSCVRSLSAMNWMSSIRRTSIFLKRERNASAAPCWIPRMNSFVKASPVMYKTRRFGERSITALPIACKRCVFPRPVPPYKKSGLYAPPGRSETDCDAACASRVPEPTTYVANV